MKKTIVLILLLIPMLCFAGALQEKHRSVIAKKNVAATGDSCTGALKLSAHFENSDTITSGTPAGCNSNADQTWTIAAGLEYISADKSDGTYSIATVSADSASKTATITADVLSASGTVVFDFYATTLGNFGDILTIDLASPDANNKLLIKEISGSYYFYYYGGGENTSVSATHTTDSWQTITIKWRVEGSPHLSIQVDSGTAGTSTDALKTLTGTLTTLNIGQATGTNEFKIDNLKVYNSWQ
jgi:hypothetical protein